MKKVEIKQFTHAEVDEPTETFGFLKIPTKHKLIRAEGDNLEVSDGYHTFKELYEHRIFLYIKLCQFLEKVDCEVGTGEAVWRSKLHSDGTKYKGWFLLGINKFKGEQITYHIPVKYWGYTEFAITLKKAPEFDGHTSQDVLERIKQL